MNAGARSVELNAWLATLDTVAGLRPEPASADASFRRYFRLRSGTQSFIVMDAPPPQEDCRPFVRIAGYLRDMGIHAPQVLESNIEQGFLLLSDLGSQLYMSRLQHEPELADTLYADAIRGLVNMQLNGGRFQQQLPPYDEQLLRFELSLFHDWLCGTHLGLHFSAAEESHWQSLCDVLVENALQQARVFVHRDYHSRNLMCTADNNPGVLDFQDAVEGPYTYDLVSLLKDCYLRWPVERVRGWALQFHSLLTAASAAPADAKQFMHEFELMGVQRHLKAAGIFARLKHRDGKGAYMADVPRTLQYIVELAPRHDVLNFIAALINEKCLPLLRGAT